ncbi:acyl-CoA thioesterase [Deferrisoma camini]|uniref:acyl-CoA thioesterase n=1 Tax=Deferrisoma camini TaxID=1035120 RepID=UPI00046D1F19|nr:thioesterase family protein [Deferrisoma camini]
MPHVTRIKVRGYHLDLYGHVNNARYLEFLEEGRWSWVEERGDLAGFMKGGYGFSVVNININYRRPAFLGDELEILTSLKGLGNRSGVVRQVVRLAGTDTVVAEADVTFVVVSAQTGRAVPLDGEVRALLAGLEADRSGDSAES